MIWKISFTRNADKFLKTNQVPEEEIIELVKTAVKKFQGENININIKKLKGEWSGFL